MIPLLSAHQFVFRFKTKQFIVLLFITYNNLLRFEPKQTDENKLVGRKYIEKPISYYQSLNVDMCIPRSYFFTSEYIRLEAQWHASRAEIRIFTPRDIKFRTILVRKNGFLTSVITSLACGSCCKLTLVRKRFIALVA